MQIRKSIALAATLAATGCADMPAGWGSPDKVLFSSPTRIKIEWNSDMTTEDAVLQKALAHCGGEVEAIDAFRDPSNAVIRSKTWQCLPKK